MSKCNIVGNHMYVTAHIYINVTDVFFLQTMTFNLENLKFTDEETETDKSDDEEVNFKR